MKHNAAELQRNVRTAWVKTFKDGGQKANWIRQQKARREAAPVRTYTAEEIAAINAALTNV